MAGKSKVERDSSVGVIKSFDEMLSAFEKRYGKNAVYSAKNRVNCEKRYSTGIFALDLLLGGGLPAGKAVEFYGSESSGKSFVTMKAAEYFLKRGKWVLLIDTESSFSPHWYEANGIPIEKLLIASPDSAEETADLIELIVLSGEIGLVILDSVSAIAAQDTLEKAADEGTGYGQQATRVYSEHRKKVSSAMSYFLRQNKIPATLLYISGVYTNIGGYGPMEKSHGGKAMHHFYSIRVYMKPEFEDSNKGVKNPVVLNNSVVHTSKIHTTKNKTFTPKKTDAFSYVVAEGADQPIGTVGNVKTLINLCIYLKIIRTGGSYFYYDSQGIQAQGKAAFAEAIQPVLPELIQEFLVNVDKLGLSKEIVHPYWIEEGFGGGVYADPTLDIWPDTITIAEKLGLTRATDL